MSRVPQKIQGSLDGPPHMVISWFGNFNLENVLRVFGSILARYSGTFVFEHSQEGRVHTVVVRHEMGSHASAYYAEYARAICELLNMPSSVTETEDQVLIKAEEPVAGPAETTQGLPSAFIEERRKQTSLRPTRP